MTTGWAANGRADASTSTAAPSMVPRATTRAVPCLRPTSSRPPASSCRPYDIRATRTSACASAESALVPVPRSEKVASSELAVVSPARADRRTWSMVARSTRYRRASPSIACPRKATTPPVAPSRPRTSAEPLMSRACRETESRSPRGPVPRSREATTLRSAVRGPAPRPFTLTATRAVPLPSRRSSHTDDVSPGRRPSRAVRS